MFFIGIDLAWSDRNKTGVAVLKANKTRARFYSGKLLLSDKEILDHIEETVGDSEAFIAIDAPLIVPNSDGMRIPEKMVLKLFRKHGVGVHPANRKRLSKWNNKLRGEEIMKNLEKLGFEHSPFIKAFEKKRKFFEVFPHPAMIVLFNLKHILKYKARKGRTRSARNKEFRKYQLKLKSLKNLFLPKSVLEVDVEELSLKELKGYEDVLDAIFCAYIAYYYWSNPEKCVVLGDMEKGYILTPRF